MQFRISLRCFRLLCKTGVIPMASATFLTVASSATAALQSGTYQTGPGSTVLETGDNVPNGSRTVPLTATLTFDLNQPALTAVIHDAVLEGGSPYADLWLGGRQQPFELTVHSSSGTQLPDGSYRFTGDYLLDIYPSGTQYIFDWQFSSPLAGDPEWTGQTYWAGGHIWAQSFSGVTLVPEPGTLPLLGTAAAILWAIRRSRARQVTSQSTSLPFRFALQTNVNTARNPSANGASTHQPRASRPPSSVLPSLTAFDVGRWAFDVGRSSSWTPSSVLPSLTAFDVGRWAFKVGRWGPVLK